jgi:cellulose synthase operon protein C
MGPKTMKRLAVAAVVLVLAIVSVFLIQRTQVARLGGANLAEAEQAVESGDLETAEQLYIQRIQVFPDDLDAKLKLADVLLKGSRTPARLNQVQAIYNQVLDREPGRLDVRRLMAELQAVNGGAEAARLGRDNLETLLAAKPDDGALEYLMGRCRETLGDFEAAAAMYKSAITHGVAETDKYDAYQRMASLLRNRLKKTAEADQAIEEMVQSDPKNYRGYLVRGRYLRTFDPSPENRKKTVADYEEALKLAPKEASIYLELALVAETDPVDHEEAARILKAGREADPKNVAIHLMLANVEQYRAQTRNSKPGDPTNKPEDPEQVLLQGIERLPDSLELRISLADKLAQRGATVALKEQIAEMARIGLAPQYIEYYEAYYAVNMKDWAGARKLLLEKLQPLDLSNQIALRASVNDLLSRCYAHLGDPERQRAALASSVRDNPNNVRIRVEWITDLAAQGKVDEAIDECRKLVDQVPQVRLLLVEQLMIRNQQIAPSRRDWKEIDDLIALAAKDAPDAPQLVLAKVRVLQAKGESSEAKSVLEAAVARDSKDPGVASLWTALADMQTNPPASLKVLDDAQAKLGDQFELRMARVRILAARGGSDAAAALTAVTEDLNALPAEQRVGVLQAVAAELSRRNDYAGAVRLMSQAVSTVPNDLQPRLLLLGLGIQAGDKGAIEQALAEIRRLEGPESNNARYGEVEYKIWQAKVNNQPAEQARLRAEARAMLAELSARRPDWSVIPLATAKLEEEELKLATDESDKKQRQSRLADLYRQAVDMGQRNLAVVRRGTEMLVASGRTAEVTQLWNKIPSLSGDGELSGLERTVLNSVINDKDYKNALEIVRQRVAARPGDFAERILLVQLLLAEKRPEEAEAELNKAVALDRSDADRWIALVQFLVTTKQIDKAEQAVKDLEKAVPADRLALAMAQCADMIGQGYQATTREPQKALWFDEAKSWYEKAQAAKPGDFALRRATTEFLLRTNQLPEVEALLTDVLKRPGDFNSADVDWARRTLALSYVVRSELQRDYPQALKALAVFNPAGGPDAKPVEKPEDLQVLARVYEAQKIPSYRKKAVEILEKLNNDRVATAEDQFLLARLYAANGEWDKARSEYRRLLEESGTASAPQELNRRVTILVQYAMQLIPRIKSDEDRQAAEEAQGLIDQLKAIQPDAFNVLSLQCRLDKAQGRIDEVVAKLKTVAERPGLSPALALATAQLAEDLEQNELAERLFKLNATASSRLQDRLAYVAFLGRRGRIKEAIDVCDPLWTSTPDPGALVSTVLDVLFSAKTEIDTAQVERVSHWVERSIQQNPKSSLFLIAMGNIRERQSRYTDAEALYRKAIALSNGDVVPLNNLAWLMALKGEKSTVPLELINRAIAMQGPIPEFLDTRAIVYLSNGESKLAIQDLENAVAIAPSAVKYFHLAQAYLEASNKPAAKENLEKARTRGLAKGNLHPLELGVYQQVVSALD